jgi:hypothetical protein
MVEIDNIIHEFEKSPTKEDSIEGAETTNLPPSIPVNPTTGSARIGNLIFKNTGALTDNVACTTSPAYPKHLKHLGLLPPNTEFFVPRTGSPIRADWHCEGWVCLYEYLFRFGMTIPLSRLSSDVMEYLSISPGQLMPAGWKLIQGIEELGGIYKAPIRISDLKSMYSSKTQSPGRVHFRVRNPAYTFISIGPALNDEKNWKAKYFFVKLASLDPECSAIRCCWRILRKSMLRLIIDL